MKLINRKEFLQMPKGTVFAKKEIMTPHTFLVQVLVRTFDDDFMSVDITSFAYWKDGLDTADAFYRMEVNPSESFEMELGITRDGLFEDEEQYYIFSRNEVQQMVDVLTQALKDGYNDKEEQLWKEENMP